MDRSHSEHKTTFSLSNEQPQIVNNNNNNSNNNNNNNSYQSSNNEFNKTTDLESNNKQQFQIGKAEKCSGCLQPITERYLLKVMNQSWHEDCLKCSCCNCRLGEVGSTLFTRANLMLCRRDYLRLFGTTGFCSACSKPIPAFEMVMKAKDNVYHLDCFSCYHCNHRFCVGDRYYLIDNKIFCEVDFEERFPVPRLTSAIPSSSSSSSSSSSNNNVTLMMNKTHPHPPVHLLSQPISNNQATRLEVGQANFAGR